MSEFEDIIRRLQARYKDLILDPSGESANKFITTQYDLKLYENKDPADWELIDKKTKAITLVRDVKGASKLIILEFLGFFNDVQKEIRENDPIENLKAGDFEISNDAKESTVKPEEAPEIESFEEPNKETIKATEDAEKLAKLDAIMNGELEQPIKEPTAVKHTRKTKNEHKIPAVIPVEMRNKQIVDLTPEDIINFVCPKANMQEAMMFLKLCQARGINPFIKEAYLVKYKQDEPAQMVVSRDYFARKAEEHPQYDGNESGIIIKNEMGDLERREGTFILPDEKLVGGWCKVYRKDRSRPTISEVAFQEYAQKTREGTLNKFWGGKPATMIRKVAFSQGHRDAFPGELSGLYDSAEIGDGAIEAEWEEVEA